MVPDIRFRYFGEGNQGAADDLQGVVEGIAIAREVSKHLDVITVRRELVPGADVQTTADVARSVKDLAWGHHACGTAKIGSADDPMAVLDKDFRIRGTRRLRVVDASVFPDIPGFFIASAVYLVSEKASDALLAEYGGAPV